MGPTLEPGDRLFVDPRAYRERPPSVGDVVVLVDPQDPGRWLVKRVAAYDATDRTVDVRGDAAEVARDSRQFGPVAVDHLRGRAYWVYHPTARRRDI
jgi:nickel-type superoxide dismutase maturation protease